MNKLYVEIANPTTHSYYSNEDYGDWEEHAHYEGIKVYNGDYSQGHANYRSSKEVDFEVTPGMIVFPVIVVYSSGNSFGSSSGNVTLVAVFDEAEKAEGLKEAIRNLSSEDYTYSFQYGGKEYYAGEWIGYFERLEDVIVETEVVRA